jgi:hypothetical protein
MITLVDVILKINPKADFSIEEKDVNQITWLNGTTPIPANEILAKQQELITEYNSNQYQRDRAKDYPSIQEQLDMQYWDKINGTNKWEEAINAVKQKYPKGNN